MKIGDLIYDEDYGMHGLIVSGPWTFEDDDGQTHEWEFLVLLEDGQTAGSDHFSMTTPENEQ